MSDRRLAARCAFAGSAFFVMLIVLFSARLTGAAALVAITIVAVLAHLVLFPVVAVSRAPAWGRAAGYGWLGLDVVLNMALLNGLPQAETTALRLGGHVLAATWIALESAGSRFPARAVGLLLAVLIALHAFAAPWLPEWAIFPPFMLIPVWLALEGIELRAEAN